MKYIVKCCQCDTDIERETTARSLNFVCFKCKQKKRNAYAKVYAERQSALYSTREVRHVARLIAKGKLPKGDIAQLEALWRERLRQTPDLSLEHN